MTKAFRPSPRKARAPAMTTPTPQLQIRLYRHGLGDCFLLRFARRTGSTFNILIDCGLISVAAGSKETMARVVDDIAAACGNRIDVVVMTHEHWDHVSGFSTQKERFDRIDIGTVWYAWTEDPQNALGIRLRAERAKKVEALQAAAQALESRYDAPMALERARSLRTVLQFFGAAAAIPGKPAIGKTRAAFDYLRQRSGVKTRFLQPGRAPLSLPDLPNVRVYVLGPPQDEALIKKSAPTKSGREVYEMAAEADLADNVLAAFTRLAAQPGSSSTGHDDCPFDIEWHRQPGQALANTAPDLHDLIQDTWDRPGDAWRRISDDWTHVAETLALNLDSHTNNTCLVLAFELVPTGEIFLFPGDAQVGNWLSWQQIKFKVTQDGHMQDVSTEDLLRRTVFYKVGHHGSHNATLRELGLEQMQSDDLVAYIPVVRAEALKNRWTGMPFGPLVERLKQKTQGRLLCSDDPDVPTDDDLQSLSPTARAAFRRAVHLDPARLYVELSYG